MKIMLKKNNCIELRIDTNEKNIIARAFYKKIGFSEIDIIPTVFNGIPNVNLVLLEKYLENLCWLLGIYIINLFEIKDKIIILI